MASQAVRITVDADKYSRASAGFGGPDQDYTICLWAYPIFKGYYQIMWACDNGDVAERTYVQFGTYYDGVWLRAMGNNSPGIDGPNPLTFDNWTFIAVTRNAVTEIDTLYWAAAGDTTLSSSTGDLPDIATTNTMYLGGNGQDVTEWFNGRIAAVKMWHSELDDAELLGEMASYQPTRTADLWANYTFWNGPQTVDNSGNGHTLTAGTAPTAATGPPGIVLDPPAGFRVGGIFDDQNGATTTDLATDGYTELEWSIQAVAPAAEGDVYEFRVYADDTPLDTYASTPQLELTTAIAFIYYGTTAIHAAYHGDTATPPFAIHYG